MLKSIREWQKDRSLKIIAVGDYDNDMEMMREADFGVAVGNGQACVKAEADYVTMDHNHYPMADLLREVEAKQI